MDLISKFMSMFDNDTVIDSVSIDAMLETMQEIGLKNSENLELLSYTFKTDSDKDGELNRKFDASVLRIILSSAGFRGRNLVVDLEELNGLNKDLVTTANTIRKDIVDETMVIDGMSDKQKAVVKVLTDINTCLSYIKNFLLVTSYIDDDEMYYSVKQKEIVEFLRVNVDNLGYFKRTNMKEVERTIDKASDEFSTKVSNKLSGSPIGKFVTNFTGNPVYFIGMIIEGIKEERYEADIDQANLTRLKIMELRAKASGGDSKSIQGQIEYYEDKLTALEENIKEYQEGV